MAPISKWSMAIGCLFLGVKQSHAGDAHHPQINTSITGKIWSKTAHPAPISESPSCSTSTTKSHRYSSVVTTIVPTTLTTTICPTTPTPTPTSVYNLCPTECSVSAGTVELFFWPTNNDYAYPSIYVEPSLGYTFTSPSVYMLINTIGGYNSLGPTGPSATSTIWPFDLGEVSTIDPDSGATRQLTLSDLGTDCPRTADPAVIATSIAGGPCDPILAAPDDIRSWALPCGACGRFGLFDPPYAIPTVTTTTTTPIIITTPPITPTQVPTPTLTTSTTATPTTVQTASATRGTSGAAWLALSLLAIIILL